MKWMDGEQLLQFPRSAGKGGLGRAGRTACLPPGPHAVCPLPFSMPSRSVSYPGFLKSPSETSSLTTLSENSPRLHSHSLKQLLSSIVSDIRSKHLIKTERSQMP